MLERITILILACLLVAAAILQSADDSRESPEIQKLIRQLGSKRFEERERAQEKLIAVAKPALFSLYLATDSTDPEIARRARECIPVIEKNVRIASLLKRFADKDGHLYDRWRAADELAELGENAAPALPALLAALDDDSKNGDTIRWRATEAIGAIGQRAASAAPKLMKILKEGKGEPAAIDALGKIGPPARDAVPLLVDLLGKGDGLTKIRAALALFRIDGDTKRTLPVLVEALGDPELDVWVNAAASIGRIAKEPALCVPPLVKAITAHRRDWFTWPGIEIIGQRRLPPGDRYPCRTLLRALAAFGPEAKAAVPTLVGFLKEDGMDMDFLPGVVEALGSIGPGAKEAVPLLRELAKWRPNGFCSKEAVLALRAIESESIKPRR